MVSGLKHLSTMNTNPLNDRLDALECEVELLKQRNARVELDKAWETSLTRRSTLIILTYFVTAIVFWLIGVENYLRNALVPALAFLLSTLTLPVVRAIWAKNAGS